MTNLDRFLDAQADVHAGYATALAELRRGRKQSHWIWYIFPQLAGLGRSDTARRFALEDLEQATAYLADPVLGARLLQAAEVVLAQVTPPKSVPLVDLMGGQIDAVKLVSSLTLFGLVAVDSSGDPFPSRRTQLAQVCQSVSGGRSGAGLPGLHVHGTGAAGKPLMG